MMLTLASVSLSSIPTRYLLYSNTSFLPIPTTAENQYTFYIFTSIYINNKTVCEQLEGILQSESTYR